MSLPICGSARGWGRGEGDHADWKRNRYERGTRDPVEMQVQPRLPVQSEKLQCVSGFRLPVCKARTSLPDFGDRRSSSKLSPPLLRARGWIAGRGSAGRARQRGQGRGAQRPSQPGGLQGRAGPPGGQSASRSLPHDRAPRGRGRAGCGRWKRRGRREGAAGGTRLDHAEEGGEEEGLGGLGELGGGKDS